jgi:hypothetical protein
MRWRWAAATIAVVLLAAIGLLLLRDDAVAPVSPAVVAEPAPTSPLSSRAEPAVAIRDDDLFVWGGRGHDKLDSELLADGAVLRGGTWRRIAASPLSPRAGAVAVPTDAGILVWGGWGAERSASGLTDGAVYDPVADAWHIVAAAPAAGRTAASGAVFGTTVAITGGTDPVSGPRASGVLWYDLATDQWAVTGSSGPVYHAAAATDQLALLTISNDDSRLRLEIVDAGTRAVIATVPLTDRRPERVGVTWDRDEILAVWSVDGRTHVVRRDADGVLSQVADLPADQLHPPVDVDGAVWARALTVHDGALVSVTLRSADGFDLRTGRRWHAEIPLRGCLGQNTPWITSGPGQLWVAGGDGCLPTDSMPDAQIVKVSLTWPR